MKESIRFFSNLLFIFVLFFILFAFAMFQGGFTSWFLLFGFLPIFLYHIGLLFYPIKNWQVTREIQPQTLHAGGHFQVKVRIERTIPFPLYYCIFEEIFPESLNWVDNREQKYVDFDQPNRLQIKRSSKVIIFPWFRRVMEYSYSMMQIPRGEHQLRAIRVRTGDVFGLIKKEYRFETADQIITYPNERQLQLAERTSSLEQGSVSTSSFHLKNTNVATGIREYLPGDKFSWIDWKQTARKNEVMTKEFEQEKSTDTLIVLDECKHAFYNPLVFEAMVEISFSFMEATERQSSQIGFLSIGAESFYMPVQHNPIKKELVRKHLTTATPVEGPAFSARLKEEMLKLSGSYTVRLITAYIDEGLLECIRQFRIRNKFIHLIYIHSDSFMQQHGIGWIKQLQQEGITVSVLTEKQLIKNPVEVKVL